MNNTEISDKFAAMWRKSRTDCGKSQDYMAKALGVSKKTVQNWESGYGSPSQIMGFKWFDVLDVPALPYYLNLLYKDFEGINTNSPDPDIRKALHTLIDGLDDKAVRRLLFLLYGDHGSPVQGILELMVAYVHTPLPARLGVAELILTNYGITAAFGRTSDHVTPDTEQLSYLISKGKEAVIKKRNSYLGGDLEWKE